MGAQMTLTQIGLSDAELEAAKRRKRQGSENRALGGRLQVRYDESKLAQLEKTAEDAGQNHHDWIRQVGDLLVALQPVAANQGMSPAELLRAAVEPILAQSA